MENNRKVIKVNLEFIEKRVSLWSFGDILFNGDIEF